MHPGHEEVSSNFVGIGAGESDEPSGTVPPDLSEFAHASEQAVRVDRKSGHAMGSLVRQ